MKVKFSNLKGLVITVEGQRRRRPGAPAPGLGITDFVSEMLLADRHSEVLKDDVHSAYCRWCDKRKIRPFAKPFFFRQLRRLIDYRESRRREGTRRRRYVEGFKLADEA